MPTLERARDKQKNVIIGQYSFLCDCGFTGRKVNDAEVWFTCERPVEPKVPACKVIHHLPSLVSKLEALEKRKEAEEFIATHEEKLAEAHAVVGEIPAAKKPPKMGRRATRK